MNVLILLPRAENSGNAYELGLRKCFPQLNINCVDHHEKVGPYIGTADVLMSFSPFMADHVMRDATRLKWIQILGSGVDGIVDSPELRKDVIVTSGQGVQATPVSEAALGLMFALSRQFPRMIANQTQRHWERWPSQLLSGSTLGILGVGRIAEALAIKAKALGMRTVGISSTLRSVPGIDQMQLRENILKVVPELDFLVALTPRTAATYHILNAAVFAAMKSSAFLVNVARGGVVNQRDLIDALERGQIRAAALDTFDEEPLPADCPLWSLPNLIVSPHLSGINSSYSAHIMPMLERNVELFLQGNYHEMLNVVHAAA